MIYVAGQPAYFNFSTSLKIQHPGYVCLYEHATFWCLTGCFANKLHNGTIVYRERMYSCKLGFGM